MKPTAIVSGLILAAAPLCSAWRLQLFDKAHYVGTILDRSQTWGVDCTNLEPYANNKATSMHWDGDGFGTIDCTIYLYDLPDCKVQIGKSTGPWHLPNFSPSNNNKVSSYRVSC